MHEFENRYTCVYYPMFGKKWFEGREREKKNAWKINNTDWGWIRKNSIDFVVFVAMCMYVIKLSISTQEW